MLREIVEKMVKFEDIENANKFVFYFEDGLELYFKKSKGEWKEGQISGGDLLDWGSNTYDDYLEAKDIYTWLQQDYSDLPRLYSMEIL